MQPNPLNNDDEYLAGMDETEEDVEAIDIHNRDKYLKPTEKQRRYT